MSNVQIPNLPAVAALSGEELFEGVQAGTSVKISLGQVIAATRTGTPTTIPLPVSAGGTGVATITGYVKGSGTTPFTGSATIPNTDITGLGTMSTQNADAVAITGGSINGTTVGATTASTIAGTTGTFSGNLSVDGDTLFVNAATNNVGIGTTSPSVKLAISGDGSQAVVYRSDNTRYAALGDTGATDDGGVLLYDSAGALQALVRGQGNSYFNGGNVGIGIASPTVALDVVGAASLTGNLTISSTGPAVVLMETDTVDQDGRIRVSAGNMRFETLTDAGALVQENMNITSTGNVLIGKSTSSGSRFEVERTDNDNAIADFKTNNASGDVSIRSSGGLVRVRATGTNEMALLTAGTERMRIDNSGNVGIGTTSPPVKLAIAGDGSQAVVYRSDNTRYAALGDTGVTDDGGVLLYDSAGALQSLIRAQSNSYVQGGNFGIGKNNPAVALDVVGSVASTGSILSSGTGGIGYATGAGAAVTQATSRTTTTPTTGANPTGAITLFTAAPVVGTYFSFTVPNTGIAATDNVILSVRGASNTYVANCTQITNGASFRVTMVSVVGTASDTPLVNYTIIKGVSA